MAKKETIKDAIIKALKIKSIPLSSHEVYTTIIERNLYKFNSKAPESLVTGELRRHCEGITLKTSKPDKLFKTKDGKYSLAL